VRLSRVNAIACCFNVSVAVCLEQDMRGVSCLVAQECSRSPFYSLNLLIFWVALPDCANFTAKIERNPELNK
jgi:hypothetical protein